MNTPQEDRRKFLRLGLTAGCGLLVAPIMSACEGANDDKARAAQQSQSSSGNPEAPTKLSKADAKYQDRPQNGNQCSGCQHFQADTKRCAVVAGEISQNGWCSLWVASA